MRFVALVAILASLPLFVAWLQSGQKNRDMAMTLLGALVFFAGTLQVDAAIITWPMWPGTTRGMLIAPADMLALALLFTRKRSGKGLPFTGLMAAYLGVLALSVIYSRLPQASTFSVWSFGRVFLIFLAVGGEMARPTAFPALVRGFAVGLMVQAGYVIQQKLGGEVQASGTMVHQNEIGMMTELVFLPLLAAMLEGERGWLVRLGALAGLIIVAGGGSRASIGLMGAGSVLLILVALIRNGTPGKYAIAGAAAAMLLAATPIALITLKDRFGENSMVTEEDQRAAMEEAARAIAVDHPLGVGANLYTTVSNTDGYSSRAGVTWFGATRAVPVHNSYMLARAETGYHGQIMLLLLLLVPAATGLVHAFRNRRARADGWVLGSVVALGVLAVHSSFEFNTLVYFIQFPFVLNIAVIAGRIRAARLEKTAQAQVATKPDGRGRGRAPAVARLPQVPVMRTLRDQETSADGGLSAPTTRR